MKHQERCKAILAYFEEHPEETISEDTLLRKFHGSLRSIQKACAELRELNLIHQVEDDEKEPDPWKEALHKEMERRGRCPKCGFVLKTYGYLYKQETEKKRNAKVD